MSAIITCDACGRTADDKGYRVDDPAMPPNFMYHGGVWLTVSYDHFDSESEGKRCTRRAIAGRHQHLCMACMNIFMRHIDIALTNARLEAEHEATTPKE